MKFWEIMTCSKLQAAKIKYAYQNKRKILMSKYVSNTNLYYEPWYVRNSDIFIIRGI